MIVFITGPSGIGKTDTSWALLNLIQPMVFLDCDWFASRVPFNWDDKKDLDSVYEALELMVGFHINRGEYNIVIPLTIQMARTFKKNLPRFSQFNIPIYAYRLFCSEDEHERRIQSRDRISWQKLEELKGMPHARKAFCELFPDNSQFKLIDSTFLSESGVAQRIIELSH